MLSNLVTAPSIQAGGMGTLIFVGPGIGVFIDCIFHSQARKYAALPP